MRQLIYPLLLTGLITLWGCTPPHVIIDNAAIYNATNNTISDIKVQHEPTKGMGAVNSILPAQALNIGLSKQPLLAKRAIITWTTINGQKKRFDTTIPYDQKAAKSQQHMNLIYTIQQSGIVTVRLDPSP